jgi:exopolysaccharide production protein ExoQ
MTYSNQSLAQVPSLPDGAAEGAAAPTSAEMVLVIAMLCVFCALPCILGDQPAFLTSVKETGITSPQGDSVKQAILMGIYGITMLAVGPHLSAKARRAVGFPLVLLFAWVGLSALWSELPSVTLRRAVALGGTLTLGVYLALRWQPRDLARLLTQVALLVLGASFVVALLLPAAGLDPEHRLRGVFSHKNSLAGFAAIALLCAAEGLADTAGRRQRLPWVAAVFSLTALALAASASPLPAVAIAALVIFRIKHMPATAHHLLSTRLAGMAFIATVLLPWIAPYVGEIALLFGRHADFSGRTAVWRFAVEFFIRNPLHGYGYASFWNGPAGLLFVSYAHFPVAHTHNGAMQLLLDCGIVGLGLLASIYREALRKLTMLLNSAGRVPNAWVAGFMLLYTFANLAETHLLEPNDLYTVLFAYVVVRINLACDADGRVQPSPRPPNFM